jgi:hypothetical protein
MHFQHADEGSRSRSEGVGPAGSSSGAYSEISDYFKMATHGAPILRPKPKQKTLVCADDFIRLHDLKGVEVGNEGGRVGGMAEHEYTKTDHHKVFETRRVPSIELFYISTHSCTHLL